jgi:hypothetical protein
VVVVNVQLYVYVVFGGPPVGVVATVQVGVAWTYVALAAAPVPPLLAVKVVALVTEIVLLPLYPATNDPETVIV